MSDTNQKLIKSLMNDFSAELKPLIQDFVIRDNKAFITLNAKDYKDAVYLERYKKECEDCGGTMESHVKFEAGVWTIPEIVTSGIIFLRYIFD